MRALYWIPRIFAGVGFVLLLSASMVITSERRFVKSAVRTTGTVTDLDFSRDSDGGGAYFPIVAFTTANGEQQTFRSRSGRNPAAYRVGDRVDVLYPAGDPAGARTAGFFSLFIGSFVLSLLAGIFSSIGFIWLWLERRARKIAEEVRQFGRRVEAKVVGIEHRTSFKVNNRSPYRVIAEHEGARFYSANIWENPEGKVGETVSVWVDRNNPKRYAMDLDPEALAATR